MEILQSCACTQRQLESPLFQRWTGALTDQPLRLHRKHWEWAWIAAVLEQRGKLGPGRHGLGFAVGEEPLTAAFANLGCTILATDLDVSGAEQGNWINTGQHARGLDALNRRGLCDPEELQRRVRFRPVDMRQLPADLGEFDFLWSSCSIEHLGSIAAGLRFMVEMSKHLKPGGVAVHTTEFNVSSDDATIAEGQDVIFRKRDLLSMKLLLERLDHTVSPFEFATGDGLADAIVDEHPYKHDPHLKLKIGDFVSTSFGIIVTAGPKASRLRQWQVRGRLNRLANVA